MTEPLSPAAQAVMIAGTMGNQNVVNDPVYRQCVAAALRAAADQVVPHEVVPPRMKRHELQQLYQRQYIRTQLLAIAAELEVNQ